ncbi:extracellular solute-binding protein [Falsirhodobacter algicola]|uniref:Extracellular solute-binding protein n=1 Tax=Falsirhodobacter algicola TaxID=2692330 RepID=A0A8J8MVT9_9RHOB|nr:extracellular solute-binding protein [Falsirhodobacter algicola]QUS37339.1 extracellular solute-binding protein [Falsirhodobacter algicola]
MKHRQAFRTSCIAVGAALVVQGTAAAAQDLPVWDTYTYENQVAAMQELIASFKAEHPDVNVNETVRSLDDLSLTLRLAVQAGNGPKVSQVNQGAKDMGTMAKSGLLVPLDDYAEEYGWGAGQSAGLIDRGRWSESGQFGEGPNYGISSLGEIVGLFYNEQILKDAGVTLPIADFEGFLDALQKVKDAGVAPIAMGTAEGNLPLHLYASIFETNISAEDRAPFDDLIYGRGGSWTTEANVKAAKYLQDWAEEGYLLDGYSGISANDAVQLFTAGQAAFLTGGTWYFGDVQNNPDIHFMPFPAPAEVEHPLSVGGVDPGWTITSIASTKEEQDLGASFIQHMVSPETAVVWAKHGYLPATALPEDADVELSGLLKEGISIWDELNADNAIGHYIDWSSPTMLDTVGDNIPLLLAGRQTPEEFAAALDADYQAYLQSQ